MTVGDILLVPLKFGLAVFLFLISPLTALLVYFFDLTVNILQLPLWLVQRVEVLYIYLGIAALSGLSLGLIFSFFSSFIFSTLSPDRRHGVETGVKRALVPSGKVIAREPPALMIKGPSFRSKGGVHSKFGSIGHAEVETSSFSPTSLSPDLISPGFRGDLGRQQMFPIMEEEDEHEDDSRGRKGKNKRRS
ncbi:hypothetical protein TWF730_005770 [Orbilia blumenaviensis]|uniref:Uncharacterized protein n=1 Tax=Orbilia blumenaviensis TaxID=1796055 RepID=A0AAV9VMJ7_9PEZI